MKVPIRLDDNDVAGYLRDTGLVRSAEGLAVSPAGDGNINWVRRVAAADGRSWIVKQARAHLEKFPEYEADPVRLLFEARYLEVARPCDTAGVLPEVLHFDAVNHVLVLQDIGDVPRMGETLAAGGDIDAELVQLAAFLGRVHRATANDASLPSRFANDQMRRLHGDHIFHLPFRPNDFPLEPPLRRRAEEIWSRGDLVAMIDRQYRRYLEPRGGLVHADVQSSNVLISDAGPVLLDGEIAHVGDPAFDIATLLAHVFLPAIGRSEIERARLSARRIWDGYCEAIAEPLTDLAAVEAYSAIEMMRRTIGAARVEPMRDTGAAVACLDMAQAVLDGESHLIGR